MNSRLLKFRAWDPVSKRMYPEFYLFGETTCFDLISQWLMEATPEASSLMRMNDAVITQFTGLQDSKGKDIFDGDILQYQSHKPEFSKCIVRWTREEEDNHPGFVIHDSYCQYGVPEIIGNIFENPELLQA